MKSFTCFIPGIDKYGRFPGLNEIVEVARANQYKASKQKRLADAAVYEAATAAKIQAGWVAPDVPVTIRFIWYEPNKRRDQDNITAAEKFILDGLVKAAVIKNDSQKYIPKPTKHELVIGKPCGVEVIVEVNT